MVNSHVGGGGGGGAGSLMNNYRSENNYLPLIAFTTTAAVATSVLICSSYYIKNPIRTWLSRLYLNYIILRNKSLPDPENNNTVTTTTDNNNIAIVSEINIYPVKSLRAISIVDQIIINSRGLHNDRKYMLIIPAPESSSIEQRSYTHKFITQRQCPTLARIQIQFNVDNTKMIFSTDLLPSNETCTISIEPKEDADIYKASLWGDVVTVQDMGNDIALYIQKIIQKEKDKLHDEHMPIDKIRLVVQIDDDTRTTKDVNLPSCTRTLLTNTNPSVALSDGYPILIASESSLDELNQRLKIKGKEPLPMSRFRPNIVIRGNVLKPFAEDRMKIIKIGNDIILHIISGCPRCKQSCTDQLTGNVTSEPIETMKEFRNMCTNHPDNVYFAVNAIPSPKSIGKIIKINDSVQVLQWGTPAWSEG